MATKTIKTIFEFNGGGIIPATADSGPFNKAITGAGPPTVGKTVLGVVLALEATAEIQNACLYQNDNLSFDIDNIVRVSFVGVSLSVALGAAAKVRFGLTGARADDVDAIAQSIFFGVTGADANVDVECDDGTNEVTLEATGQTLALVPKKFVIDFSQGVHTSSPPPTSAGGKAAVQLSMDNVDNVMRRVNSGTRFNMDAYAGGLQLFTQIQKTSSTDLGSIAIQRIEVEHKVAA